jgi:hypothetical protein
MFADLPKYTSLHPFHPCVHQNFICVSVSAGFWVAFRCIWIHIFHVMTLTLLAFSMIAVCARKGILERLYSVMFGLVIRSISPGERNACYYQNEQFLPWSLPPPNDASAHEQSVSYRPVTFSGLYSPKGTRDLNHFLMRAPLKLIENIKSENAPFIQEALSKINASHDSYHFSWKRKLNLMRVSFSVFTKSKNVSHWRLIRRS